MVGVKARIDTDTPFYFTGWGLSAASASAQI